MNNLQELYDAYLATKPYSGKIKSATSMMIHVCKALNLSTQEEVTADYFEDVPRALNEHFENYPLKSTQDKAILAEMIGRVGTDESLLGMLDQLLTDTDENVRQYSLHSLGFFGKDYPEKVIPFVERFRKSNDFTMKTVAAHLLTHLVSSGNQEFIFSKLKEWFKEGDLEFVKDVSQRIVDTIKKGELKNISLNTFIDWLKTNFDNKVEIKQ
jgi:HEAT repeat protein